MPITVEEKASSPTITSGDNPSAELSYVIRGTTDEFDARTELETVSLAVFDGLVRTDVRVTATESPSVWDGEVAYALPSFDQPEVGESTFSFDTGGGTQHLTQSLATVASYAPPSETAPDFKGAIGVTADSVEGVDIVVPVYQFSETHVLPDATVTDAYKAVLMIMTGRVNSDVFRSFAAGSVLFLGAAGAKRGDGDWEITFRFAVSPNLGTINVGDITGITKKGWEYLWVRYEDVEDAAAQTIVKQPVAAYVERVYLELPFTTLGI